MGIGRIRLHLSGQDPNSPNPCSSLDNGNNPLHSTNPPCQ